MTDDLTRLAEDAGAHLPPRRGGRREHHPGFTVRYEAVDSPKVNSVHAVRVDDVPATVATVREWFAAHGRHGFTWWLGTSARPADLVERLLDAGATEADAVRAMVLEDEPPGGGDGAPTVRRVQSEDDYLAAVAIQCDAFGTPEDERRQALANAPARWREMEAGDTGVRYLAEVDGRPVGTAGMERLDPGPALLVNGCVLEAERGRGAYRELLRARWRDACELGWLPLVVQAGSMSAPILERVGFRTVGALRLLRDQVR